MEAALIIKTILIKPKKGKPRFMLLQRTFVDPGRDADLA